VEQHLPSSEFGSEFVKEGNTASTTSTTVTGGRDIIGIRRCRDECGSSHRDCVRSAILRRGTRDCRAVLNAALEIRVVAGGYSRWRRWKWGDTGHGGVIIYRTTYTTLTLMLTRNKSNAYFEALQYRQMCFQLPITITGKNFPAYTRCSENHNNICAEIWKIRGLKFDTVQCSGAIWRCKEKIEHGCKTTNHPL